MVRHRLRLTVAAALIAISPAAAQAQAAGAPQTEAGWSRRLAADRSARAAEYAARGDTALALSAYAEALRTDDSYGPAWLGFGRLREAVGDDAQAELAYTRASELDETRSQGLEARGALLIRQGNVVRGLADLQLAADLAPTPERLELLGRLLAERRAWPAALGVWRRLLSLLEARSPEATRAKLEISALRVLAGEVDAVSSGARERGWIRSSLAHIERRTLRSRAK